MRIVFCGTPEFAVPSLRRLAAHPEFSVEAVITQPDRPRGRGQHVSSFPGQGSRARSRPARLPARNDQIRFVAGISEARRSRCRGDYRVRANYSRAASDDSAPRLDQSCTRPCCRAIAAPRRFTGPSPTAKRSPGSPPCRSTRAWIRVRLCCNAKSKSARDETAPELVRAHERSRRRTSSWIRCCNSTAEKSPRRRRIRRKCHLCADPEKGRRPDRLDAHRPANLQPHARLHSLARGVHHVPRKTCHLWGHPEEAAQQEATSRRAKLFLRQRMYTWYAEKERVCASNSCKSRAASGSPRTNSRTARGLGPMTGLYREVRLAIGFKQVGQASQATEKG